VDAAGSDTFRAALTAGIKSWRRFVISNAGSEVAAVLAVMMLVGVVTIVLAIFMDAPVSANGKPPANQCAMPPVSAAAAPNPSASSLVRVSDASGANGTLSVYTGRGNETVQRQSTQLSVQNGQLPANACLATAVSDLVRSDGQAIPASQVVSWAQVDNTGTRVTVFIQLSPRYGTVTAAGGYAGSVYLDDARATGGNVPVDIHVEYPFLWRAAMLCIAAAWVGFFWAWLVNLTKASDTPTSNRFWLYVTLQLAVLTVVSFPVFNAQVLTNADWTGDLSQYITLATLAGGGALAATPTLRALIDRVVIPLVSGNASASATDPGAPPANASAPPANSSAPPADSSAPPANANGDTAAPTDGEHAPGTAASPVSAGTAASAGSAGSAGQG
jgi:hypothetical protein